MADREKVINHFQDTIEASGNNNKWRFVRVDVIEDAIELLKDDETQLIYRDEIIKAHEDEIERLNELLKEQEPRVMTLDEAASAQEVWVEAWLSVPKKYVVMVTVLYPTDDCKNFELELLGTSQKAFMLTEEYGHTWRCWTAKPTNERRQAVKYDG